MSLSLTQPTYPSLDDLTRLMSDNVPTFVKFNNQSLYVNNSLSSTQVVGVDHLDSGLCTNNWSESRQDVLKNIMENKKGDPLGRVEISMCLLNLPDGIAINPYERIDDESFSIIKFPEDKHEEIMKYIHQHENISSFSQKANNHVLLTTNSRGDGRFDSSLLSPELTKIHEDLSSVIIATNKYYQYHEGFKITLEFPKELIFLSKLQWYVEMDDYRETTSDYCPYLRIKAVF